MLIFFEQQQGCLSLPVLLLPDLFGAVLPPGVATTKRQLIVYGIVGKRPTEKLDFQFISLLAVKLDELKLEPCGCPTRRLLVVHVERLVLFPPQPTNHLMASPTSRPPPYKSKPLRPLRDLL